MDVLVLNGHDYTGCVEMSGYSWSRNDIDSEKTTRLKNGTLRRAKLTEKRKLQFRTLPGMAESELAQLDDDLALNTFAATYYDLHGLQTRTFYCSSFSATMDYVNNETPIWGKAEFTITEV